jgi:DNA polymerase I-like protein with 3'-5' exonuclease and polymerase domains
MKIIACDIETNGLKKDCTTIYSFQVAYRQDGEVVSKVYELHHVYGEDYELNSDVEKILKTSPWFHNASFDVAILRKFGYEVPLFHCSMLLSNCYHANVEPIKGSKHGLSACGARVGVEKAEYDGGWDEWNEDMAAYAEQDVVTTLAVVEDLLPKIQQDSAAWWHYTHIEQPYMESIIQMEAVGFPVIFDGVLEGMPKLTSIIQQRLQECRDIVPLLPQGTIKKLVREKPTGFARGDYCFVGMDEETGKFMYKVWDDFKPSSTQQLAESLEQVYGWVPKNRTKKGAVQLDEAVLSTLSYPLAVAAHEYRKAEKVMGTFLSAALNHTNEDFRLRTSWNQALTLTGRLSTSSPLNAQNLPADPYDPLGNIIRGFIGVEGERVLVSCDLAAIEYRVLTGLMAAQFVKYDSTIPPDVEYMLGVFADGLDIHTAMADLWLPDEPNRKLARSRGKNISYGRIYGFGAAKASVMLGIPEEEAQVILDKANETNPSFNTFHERTLQEMRDAGGLGHTLYGRRLWYPNLLSKNKWDRLRAERQAFNARIQGTAADILKIIQITAVPEIPPGNYFCGSVHDETLVDCVDKANADVVCSILDTCCAMPLIPYVPCGGSARQGKSWAEVH